MTKMEQLSKLSHDILDAEVKIAGIANSMKNMAKELTALTMEEKQLEENIALLKTKKIITVASEYRKIKAEIAKIRTRKDSLLSDGLGLEKIKIVAENTLENLKNEYEILDNSKENVIRGLFGTKK